MAPTKRPASHGPTGTAKRSSRDPVTVKCRTVAKTLRDCEEGDLPENVREMLADMVPSSLSVFAAERHPFQAKTVDMVEEALTGMESKMETVVTEAQAKVDAAAVEQAARIAAVSTAESHLKDSEEKAIAARETSEVDAAALKEAKAALVSAQAAEQQTGDELAEKARQDSTLQAANAAFGDIRVDKLAGHGRKTFGTISSALAEICGVESSLIDALHGSLKKLPTARGSFDKLVEEKVAAAIATTTEQLQQALSASDSTKAAAAAATAAAEAASVSATEKSAASRTSWEAAVATSREAQEALNEAKDAAENFEDDVKEAASALEMAKANLSVFQEGPRAAFVDLKSLAVPEEPMEEAKADDEKAAAVVGMEE